MNVAGRFQLNKRSEDADRVVRILTRDAAQSVPYFRDLFAHSDLEPDSIDSVESLSKLPITPRRRLSELPRRLFLRDRIDVGRLHSSYTSGSTGTPAHLFRSKAELAYRRLLLLRATRACFPQCLPTRVLDLGQITTPKSVSRRQRFGPIRLTRVPGSLHVSEQAKLYVESKPQLLEGYAGCLELLARELRLRKRYPKPRCVISRGEVLTQPARELMERVFDAPVANFYNSEEIGNMAWECPDRKGILHVNTDACVLELLDDAGVPVPVGVEGRVVVTNLYNRSMPLVRYDIGDHATWENPTPQTCSCGATTPTLSDIDGRTDDFILLPDSSRVSPLVVLTTALFGVSQVSATGALTPQVLQFQVVQEEIGRAIVRVVLAANVPDDLEDSIAAEFRKLHPQFSVQVSEVEDISPEPSGKLKRIISRVPE